MLLNSETIPCEIIQAYMVTLLDNELGQSDATTLRSHLEGCPTCAEDFKRMQQTLRTADAWKAAGLDIWQAIENQLGAEYGNPKADAPRTLDDTQRVTERHQNEPVITAEQLAAAQHVHRDTGHGTDRILTDLGHAAERDVFEARARAERLPLIDLTKHKPEQSAISVVPAHLARKHNALPVKKDGTKLWVAVLNPRDVTALDEIRMVTRCQVAPLLAFPEDLARELADAYPEEMTRPVPEPEVAVSQEDLRAVLSEMRALRSEIQELRGEVGTLRRLLTVTRQATPSKVHRPLSPPQIMPMALPENGGLGLL